MGSRLEIADVIIAFRRPHLFVCLFVCFLFCALIHGKKFYARVFDLQDMDDKERFCKAFTGKKTNVSATNVVRHLIIKRK